MGAMADALECSRQPALSGRGVSFFARASLAVRAVSRVGGADGIITCAGTQDPTPAPLFGVYGGLAYEEGACDLAETSLSISGAASQVTGINEELTCGRMQF